MRQRFHHGLRPGYVFPEAVVALFLMTTIATLLTAVLAQRGVTRQHNQDLLQAQRLAQNALHAVQLGQLPPPIEPANTVTVEPVVLPNGLNWIAVTARCNGRTARLLGPRLQQVTR